MRKRVVLMMMMMCVIFLLSSTYAMAETFKTVDGQVVMEAEDATNTFETFCSWQKFDDYVQSTDEDPSTAPDFNQDACRLDYTINFREKGIYFLHLLTRADDRFQNGFFATLDGEPINYGGVNEDTGKTASYIYVQKTGHWRWYTDGGGTGGRGLPVSMEVLSTGSHTFSIYRRDKNSKIDRIWLTSHDSRIYDWNSPSLPNASIFIDDDPPNPGPGPGPISESHSFTPVEDAYLQGSRRYNNDQLRLDVKNKRVSYLKFDINEIATQKVDRALLRLRVNRDGGIGPMSIFQGNSNNWTETNLNNSNAPRPTGAAIAKKNESYLVDHWYEFDVTSTIAGVGVVTFIIQKDTTDNDVAFGSKEGAGYEPELVIETRQSPTPQNILLTLVNADTDRDLLELNASGTINLESVGRSLNIRADVDSKYTITDVRFYLDGNQFHIERKKPYSFAGDNAGDYLPWTPVRGAHTIDVIAYNNGKSVVQRTINFTVISSSDEKFDKGRGDLISLHYDHMPDPDDGHATVAGRTVTGYYDITPHVVAGTHSFPVNRKNASPPPFQQAALDVMSATWGNAWLNAHNDYAPNAHAVERTAARWHDTLQNGGHVWVAEGGPSDFTANVLRYLHDRLNYRFQTPRRIHVVQHGAEPCKNPEYVRLNEKWTAPENLQYVQNNTDYEIIGNGNCEQDRTGNDAYEPTANFRSSDKAFNRSFKNATSGHRYEAAWAAAFSYWDPVQIGNNKALHERDGQLIPYPWAGLDFSDTVELMHILDIKKEDVEDCRAFLNVFIKR